MDSEEKRSRQARRKLILTLTGGAVVSGGLAKFAVDTMPSDPPPGTRNPQTNSGESSAKPSPASLASARPSPVPGVATAEKTPLQGTTVAKPNPPSPVQPPLAKKIPNPQSKTQPVRISPMAPRVPMARINPSPPSKPLTISKSLPTLQPPLKMATPKLRPNMAFQPNVALQPIVDPSGVDPFSVDPSSQVEPEMGDSQLPDLPVQLTDIRGHWAQYFIQTLADREIIRGYGNGNFRPNAVVTRSEFVQMTRRAFEEKAPASPVSFQHLQTFADNASPTRAEAAMFIHQALVKSDMVLSVTDLRVRGAVARPGRYSLAGLSEQDPQLSKLPTIARAIEYAGGIQPSADLKRVQINRTTETGQKHMIVVNLNNPHHDLILEQGDELVIPENSVADTRYKSQIYGLPEENPPF
jgi:hypothetical protein